MVYDAVQRSVTLRLRNVPWDQALDIVMTTKGLDMRQNGNVIMVAPAEEIAARETADLEAQLAISELEPMYSEFLQVNYAKAADLAALITGEGGGNAMMSDRGRIGGDERTNTLLVPEPPQRRQHRRQMPKAGDQGPAREPPPGQQEGDRHRGGQRRRDGDHGDPQAQHQGLDLGRGEGAPHGGQFRRVKPKRSKIASPSVLARKARKARACGLSPSRTMANG